MCVCVSFFAGLFEKRRRYGVPVNVARHPELCQYISDALHAVRPWAASGSLATVELIIISPVCSVRGPSGGGGGRQQYLIFSSLQAGQPLERFVFDMGLLPPEPLCVVCGRKIKDGGIDDAVLLMGVLSRRLATPPDMLERYLRAIILKLNMADSVLKPLPPGGFNDTPNRVEHSLNLFVFIFVGRLHVCHSCHRQERGDSWI